MNSPAARRTHKQTISLWVPREHGAWAMLIAPVVVGALLAPDGPGWRHGLLLVVWLVAYCALSSTGRWLKSRRKARYVPPVVAYALAAAVLGGVLLAVAPALVAWVPVFAVALVGTLVASTLRAERSWANDVLTILAASLMTVVSAGLRAQWAGPMPPGAELPSAWVAAGILAAYFLGTVPYVKTMIRDRGNSRVLLASELWHAALVVAAIVAALTVRVARPGWAWAVVAVAGVLLVRAVAMPRHRPWFPAYVVGAGEVVATVAVAIVTLGVLAAA